MIDGFLLMLRVKLLFVDRIHPHSNNFVTGVENKATGDSKHNDSSDLSMLPEAIVIYKGFKAFTSLHLSLVTSWYRNCGQVSSGLTGHFACMQT